MISIKCDLTLEGVRLDLTKVTQVVGRRPTVTRQADMRAGQMSPGRDVWGYRVETWGCSSVSVGAEVGCAWPAIEVPVRRLLDAVSGREDDIAVYCRSHNIDVLLVVVIGSSDEQLPSLDLPSDIVLLLARLGAALVFDTYLNLGADYGEGRGSELPRVEQG